MTGAILARPVEAERAKRAVEGLRYRLRVRLGLIARVARRDRDPDLLQSAKALQVELRALRVEDSEWLDQSAEHALRALELRVAALEDAAGILEQGPSVLPRWIRYLLFTIPVVALFLLFLVAVDRRKRSRAVAAEDLLELDRAGRQPGGGRGGSVHKPGSSRSSGRGRSDTALK